MSKCNQCSTAINFMSVLNTINPLKIKCSSCKEPILLQKKSALTAVILICAVIFPILTVFYNSPNYWVYIVLPTILGAELVYFLTIKFGIVKVAT